MARDGKDLPHLWCMAAAALGENEAERCNF